jgi:nitrite reductase (NADH) large subunit
MLVGNNAATGTLVQLFDRGDPMPPDPLEALCQRPSSSVSTDRQVCNCHKVSEGVLKDAIANGADTVSLLSETTKAGTGCGSCKGELAQLIAVHAQKTNSLPAVAAS